MINAGGLLGTTNSVQGLIINNGALTFLQPFDGVFSGVIGGTGTLTKLGAGSVTFGGANPYTGLTTIGQGTLTLENASLDGSVSVGTQAALAGTGTIGGNLTIGGRLLLPGITPGRWGNRGCVGIQQGSFGGDPAVRDARTAVARGQRRPHSRAGIDHDFHGRSSRHRADSCQRPGDAARHAHERQHRQSEVDLNLFKKSGAWRPRIVLNYLHEFADDSTLADVNFQQRPDSQFEVTGLPIPRDVFHGLFGLTMRSMSGLEYTFEYETTQASNESHNAVHFRMRFK